MADDRIILSYAPAPRKRFVVALLIMNAVAAGLVFLAAFLWSSRTPQTTGTIILVPSRPPLVPGWPPQTQPTTRAIELPAQLLDWDDSTHQTGSDGLIRH